MSWDPHTLFLTLAGSHAHGTAGPGSDVDLRGVLVVPLDQRLSYRGHPEQVEDPLGPPLADAVRSRLQAHPTARHGLAHKVEIVRFDLAKLVRLCADANPNALEILFADPADHLHTTALWQRVRQARHRFLSRKVGQTFLGYALAQLKRIRTHRAWLLQPPRQRPTRADFGLPDEPTLNADDRNRIEQAVADRLRSWELGEIDLSPSARIALQDRMERFWQQVLAAPDDGLDEARRTAAGRSLGLSGAVLKTLSAERRYRAAMKHFESHQTWKRERNPQRAALEARHGYDTKHAMHLVRLMRMGTEALQTGEIQVRRPDAAELQAIRDGAFTYEALLAEAERWRERLSEAQARSPLPPQVDHEAVDALLVQVIREAAGCP